MQNAVPTASKAPPTQALWLWLLTGAVLLAALVYLFTPGMLFIAGWWQQEEYSHGWLIPPVAAFILWQRRGPMLASRGGGQWFGAVLVLLGLLLFLLGEAAQFQRIDFLALVIVLMGVGFAAVGWSAMRYAWVPVGFLLFAMPLPGSVYVPLTLQLQFISSELGAFFLDLIGISVFLDGNIIDLGVYKLQVAEACSGLRYLFPLAAFGFLCAWLYKAPLWARALVLISIVPITVIMNSIRIALTGVFVEYGSIELAEGFMHLFEGWIIFIVSLVILFAFMWVLSRFCGERTGPLDLLDFDRMEGKHIPVRDGGRELALPASLIAATALIILALPAHAAVTGRDQIIPERPGLVTYPLVMEAWRGRPAALDSVTLGAVGSDDYLLADYTSATSGKNINLWVAYYDEQIRDSAIHSPKDCLPGGGWEYVTFEPVDAPVTRSDGRTFQLNRAVIAKGQDQMLLYYWLEMRGRQLTNDFTLKFYNLWDSLTQRRSDGALIRLITPLAPGETPADGDARMAEFLQQAYPQLERHTGA